MTVTLNGERREVAAGTTLLDLLNEQGEPYDHALVERNHRLVRRDSLAETVLEDDDDVEVILPAFGG